ncbi:bifunctional diguanylate cyclase/phosphodiesterase [Marinomonas epiphytica]
MNTLKGRLYLLSFLIIAPCFLFIYLSFNYSRSIVVDELLQSAERISKQAAHSQNNQIKATQSFLKSLVNVEQLKDPNSELCQSFIEQIVHLDDHYINIGVPNDKGILTCNGTKLNKSIDVSHRQYIQEAIALEKFTSSGVQIDQVMQKPTINFAYPVHHDEKVVGAAVVVMSLDWWGDFLIDFNLPSDSVAYVLDANRNIMASFPSTQALELPDVLNQITEDEYGVGRVYSEHSVHDLEGNRQLVFLTGIGVDQRLTQVNIKYTSIVIMFFVFILIVLSLFRLFFLNAIAKPINKLTQLIYKIERNEDVAFSKSTGVLEMDTLQTQFIDMTARKLDAEKLLIRQAQTDALTGVCNRYAFNQKLEELLEVAGPLGQKVAVLLVDLDEFKEINETRGHELGDKILQKLAERLVKSCDFASVTCRPGGDEFLFILEGSFCDDNKLTRICDDILKNVRKPIVVNHQEIYLNASLGAAVYPKDGDNAKTLVSAVDQALYHAKKMGKNSISRFNKHLKQALLDRVELIKALDKAIFEQDFFLVYQPILNTNGGVVKFEALIRWNRSNKGVISPDLFIPIAEESGHIVDIGYWVIQTAQRDLKAFRESYGSDIQISVNVSPIQLARQGRPGCPDLTGLLKSTNDSRESSGLVVEITENSLMNLNEETRLTLLAFREQGIQVALDDFGTGYSSLAYIMNYDIDYLKIDQGFVRGLSEGSSSATLCEAIISMAHSLGISVIAEGVETEQQANCLINLGCDYLQGYLFAKPMALEEALVFKGAFSK